MTRIKLEVTPPNKISDAEWIVAATATTFESDKKPVPNVEILFYLNGKKDEEDSLFTDGEGRKAKDFVLPKGKHEISVKIKGEITETKKPVVVKEDEPKQPENITVDVSGRDGDYELFIQVTSKNRKGIPANLMIINERGKEEVEEKETDKQGFCKHLLKFEDRIRIYRVIVLGVHNLGKTVYLSGPSRIKKGGSK